MRLIWGKEGEERRGAEGCGAIANRLPRVGCLWSPAPEAMSPHQEGFSP